MSQVDVDSGIENMEVDESDRREKRSLTDKVGEPRREEPESFCCGCNASTYLEVQIGLAFGFITHHLAKIPASVTHTHWAGLGGGSVNKGT